MLHHQKDNRVNPQGGECWWHCRGLQEEKQEPLREEKQELDKRDHNMGPSGHLVENTELKKDISKEAPGSEFKTVAN